MACRLLSHTCPQDCRRWFYWQNSGAVLQVITTHGASCPWCPTRSSAHSFDSRARASLVGDVWVIKSDTCCHDHSSIGGSYNDRGGICSARRRSNMCALPSSSSPHLILVLSLATNNPFPDVYICADADPAHKHWYSWYWTTVMGIEAILLGLAMYKVRLLPSERLTWLTIPQAYQNRSTGEGGRLMRALSHESVLYFVGYVTRLRTMHKLTHSQNIRHIRPQPSAVADQSHHSQRACNRFQLRAVRHLRQPAHDQRTPPRPSIVSNLSSVTRRSASSTTRTPSTSSWRP